jgi:plastocyanin
VFGTKHRVVSAVCSLVLVVSMAACGGGSTNAAPAGNSGSGNTVTIKDFSFGPASLTVSAGATVTFENHGTQSHTATSDTPGQFDAGTVAPGTSTPVTFATKGTFAFHCSFHPTMHGTITVN